MVSLVETMRHRWLRQPLSDSASLVVHRRRPKRPMAIGVWPANHRSR